MKDGGQARRPSAPLLAGPPHGMRPGPLPGLLSAFAATLFLSAFLLFAVQPMVSRLVLPRLGGSPAVWNSCVCFFQAALLLAYGYADLSALRLPPARGLVLHLAVLAAGLAMLPLSIGAAVPAAGINPAIWLTLRLAVTVGPPFFAIAATAPLLQHWFSRTGHPAAADPYFLYSASNAGSLLALLATPLVAEPLLGLSDQTRLWSAGFCLCAAAVVACAVAALLRGGDAALLRGGDAALLRGGDAALTRGGDSALSRRNDPTHRDAEPAFRRPDEASPPGPTLPGGDPLPLLTPLRQALLWVTLAFVPSGLMLAVTTYITTDIAAAPLFWVIPLAIYIATYMVAFGRRSRAMPRLLPPLQAIALAAAGVTALMGVPSLAALAVALIVFTLTAAVCHIALANARPAPDRLTRYYLLISVGGVLGGVLNALVAPSLFRGPWEYPLLLILACALRPRPAPAAAKACAANAAKPRPGLGGMAASRQSLLRLLVIVLIGAALVYASSPYAPAAIRPVGLALGIALPVAALAWLSRRGAYLGVGLASLLIVPLIVRASSAELSVRSFFGTYRVFRIPAEGITVLQHGTTLHGVQSDRPGEQALPLGYYAHEGPFGRLFAALRRAGTPLPDVGVIGLGAGALGCYAQPGEHWVFREIDPVVERLARDTRFFHFLQVCGNDPAVLIGDARITLAADRGGVRDSLLIVDAFSSDAVPVHLLTREALALYFAHLRPGGIVVFHISNRYLDLAPVIARLAADAGAPARHLLAGAAVAGGYRSAAAELIAVGAPGANLDVLAADGWDVPKPGRVLWTDDRSDIAGVIRW